MKSVVFPAPFGPMTPSELALADLERDIGDDRRAADVEPEVAGGEDRSVACDTILPWPAVAANFLLRRRRVLGRDALRATVGAYLPFVLDELDLEHRLQHRVILRPDRLLALRARGTSSPRAR